MTDRIPILPQWHDILTVNECAGGLADLHQASP